MRPMSFRPAQSNTSKVSTLLKMLIAAKPTMP